MKSALLLLTISTYSGAALTFLTQVLLARNLSSYDFGAFSAALTIITLVTPIAGFGVSTFWLKAFGEEGWQGLRWIKPSIRFTLLTMGLSVSITLCVSFLLSDGLTSQILYILIFFIFGQVTVELTSSIYQLEERYKKLAIFQFLPHFIRCTLLLIAILFLDTQLTSYHAAIIYTATASLIILLGSPLIYKAHNGRIDLEGHNRSTIIRKFEKEPTILNVADNCWPFGLGSTFYFLYFQSNIVLIKFFIGNESAAQYSIAITIMTAIYLFPNTLYQKLLLPKIHRWANQDKNHLKKVYENGNISMLAIGITTCILVYFLSPTIIPIVFGNKYLGVIELISILSFSIPFRFVATSVGAMLVTKEHMRKKVIIMGFVAVFNITITTAFIINLGIYGAGYATIATDILLLVLYYSYVRKFIFKKEKNARI